MNPSNRYEVLFNPSIGLRGYTRGALGDVEAITDEYGNTYYIDEQGYIVGAEDASGGIVNTGTVDVDTSSPSAPSNVNSQQWVDLLTKVTPQIIAGINAYQLSQINIDRARRGLPALNTQTYGPRVNVGMTPQSQKTVMYAALAIGAFMLLKKR